MKMGTINVGHKMTPEEILERVNKFWDTDRKFPVPRKKIKCPVCQGEDLYIAMWQFFRKPSKMPSFRCDIAMKCSICGYSWIHGLTITEEQYELGGKRRWSWQAVQKQWEMPNPESLDNEYWDFDECAPFPVPTRVVFCPQCERDEALTHSIIKSWEFTTKPMTNPPIHHCDIAFKCGRCSCVWAHRIEITKKQFLGGSRDGKARRWTWRQAWEKIKS